jgi:hypothetical protein
MSRPWPTRRVVAGIIRECSLQSTRVEGGDIVSSDGVIRHWLSISKGKYDKTVLEWAAFAEDERYSEPLREAGLGGIWVAICRPTDAVNQYGVAYRRRFPWPQTGGQLPRDLVVSIARYGTPALRFVRDRVDLGWLLLGDGEVWRGEVFANLSLTGAAARVVEAIILARDLGEAELEAAAFAKLEREGKREVMGWPGTFWDEAVYWAKEYAPQVDVELGDLIRSRRPLR